MLESNWNLLNADLPAESELPQERGRREEEKRERDLDQVGKDHAQLENRGKDISFY